VVGATVSFVFGTAINRSIKNKEDAMIVTVKKNGPRTFRVLELWTLRNGRWVPMGTHRNLKKYIGVVFHGYGRGEYFSMWGDVASGQNPDAIMGSFPVAPGKIKLFPTPFDGKKCLPPKGEADAYIVADRASDLFCLTEPF
jgi:hypothetical protein